MKLFARRRLVGLPSQANRAHCAVMVGLCLSVLLWAVLTARKSLIVAIICGVLYFWC